MTIEVRPDDLSSQEVRALIAEHLAGMHSHSPPGHVNALAIEGLRRPEVTFWAAWRDGVLCGCGALKQLDATSGEVKSMRTRAAFLRQGVGQAVLDEIVCTARRRGYRRLLLETGTGAAFEAAHALYLRNGFDWCEAFGDYEATDFNVFMAKPLTDDIQPEAESPPSGATASPLASDDLAPLPTVPLGLYRHYKGGEYEVLGVVRHSETLAPLVLYRPLREGADAWVRPYAMFIEDVTIDGVTQPRFALVQARPQAA